MIVTCEKCSTQFYLDDSKIPKRGVKARCSRCKHAFL
ncbi:MAG: zinc-ribbon domain-containing protein, partial [Myxococcota bacterium]